MVDSQADPPPMTSRLVILRFQLARLQRARLLVRVLAAGFGLLGSLLMALLALFALDVLFLLGVVERVIVMALATAAVGWGAWRYAWPLLLAREDALDL